MTRLWPEGEALEAWGGNEVPDGFLWRGAVHRVEHVWNRWRIHTNWWQPGQILEKGAASQSALRARGPASVWREYVKVTTDSGLLCLLYQDVVAGGWFLARVYD